MELIERLNVPLCQKTRIPVKTLVEQLQAEPSQKKLLETHIASIYLVSLLNEQTMRIRAYKDDNYSFMVIYVLQIELKANDQLSDLCELIHSAFPESTLLLLKYKNTEYLSSTSKRINKNDKTKTVVEDTVWSMVQVTDNIEINTITAYDLKCLYENINRLVYSLKVKGITGIYPKRIHDYKKVIREYEMLKADINRLEDDYKKATMRSEKITIDDNLFEKERELENLIRGLKEEE